MHIPDRSILFGEGILGCFERLVQIGLGLFGSFERLAQYSVFSNQLFFELLDPCILGIFKFLACF